MQSANFVALEAEETTDNSKEQQMVVITYDIRYAFNEQICKRF